jgi:hypothetical protein
MHCCCCCCCWPYLHDLDVCGYVQEVQRSISQVKQHSNSHAVHHSICCFTQLAAPASLQEGSGASGGESV